MSTLLEILKYILPSMVVMGTSYFLIKQFLENDNRKKLIELKLNNQSQSQKFIIPVRLQAYERIILFLERITPENLIIRVSQPGMDVLALHTTLIKTIRDEYEHNLSQQLYLSPKSWQLVKNVKDELVKLINEAASQSDSNAESTELAKNIFILTSQLPIDKVIESLKNEIQEYF
jgi:hypothetical protein